MPFALETVSPEALAEAQGFNAKLEALLATQPPIQDFPAQTIRDARRVGKGIFPAPVFLPEAETIHVRGRSGSVGLRIVRPSAGTPKGVYLHIHGGGWMLGGADMQDVALRDLANATGLVVASVDYRLAPEHPYPAGPDDCEDAALWLIDEGAPALAAPAKLSIGGESAGAHLSAATLVRLRDRCGKVGPFCAAVFSYGAFDLSLTPSTRAWGDRNLVLSGPIIDHFNTSFLPALSAEEKRAPDISPLYADLRALPPAFFSVGTLDPLFDDTVFMESRWLAAGNAAELHVWPEAVHGFTAYPLAISRLADEAQAAFLRKAYA